MRSKSQGAEVAGFPIWMKGLEAAPVGAIVVSGLAQLEDHQVRLPHPFFSTVQWDTG